MKLKTLHITLIATILLALSFTTKASDECLAWATVAEGVMQSRQENVAYEDVVAHLIKTTAIPEEAKAGVLSVINAAYKNPVQDTIQNKLNVIKLFGDGIFLQCIKETQREV